MSQTSPHPLCIVQPDMYSYQTSKTYAKRIIGKDAGKKLIIEALVDTQDFGRQSSHGCIVQFFCPELQFPILHISFCLLVNPYPFIDTITLLIEAILRAVLYIYVW